MVGLALTKMVSPGAPCQLAAGVVTVRVMGLEHAQAIADGQAGGDDQEPAGKFVAVGLAHGIDGVPGNQHGHNSGLASAGGQFQRQPHERRVGVVIGIGQVFQEGVSNLTSVRGNLGEPDGGFHRLHLAEEGPDVAERVMPPMLQQTGGFGRDVPVMWIRQAAPLIDLLPNGVNDGRMVVLLCLCGQPLAFVEHDLLLCDRLFALPGLWNRRDKLCAAAALENLLCRLTLVMLPLLSLAQLPSPSDSGGQ
jgi:hypothetical protein